MSRDAAGDDVIGWSDAVTTFDKGSGDDGSKTETLFVTLAVVVIGADVGVVGVAGKLAP